MRKPTLSEAWKSSATLKAEKEKTAKKLAMEKEAMTFYDEQDRLDQASHDRIMEDLHRKEAVSLATHEKRMAELAAQRRILDEEIQRKDEALDTLLDRKISVEEYISIIKKGL